MDVKVHWIIDGVAELDAETLEEAEQKVDAVLRDVISKNPELVEMLGARAGERPIFPAPRRTSMSSPTIANRRRFLALAASVAAFTASPAMAAGRTYKSQREDDRVLFELCRLKKRDYIDGGTNCVYSRQTGGKDVVIKVDGQKVRCQSEFQCKRIK